MAHSIPRHVSAISLSSTVAAFIQKPRRGTVLATFARSAYLDLDGSVVAIVAKELLNGPLNVVLSDPAPRFEELTAGRAVTVSADGLRLERWPVISVRDAVHWDPRIRPWTPGQMPDVIANLDILAERVMAEAPADSLAHPRIEQAMANLRSALSTSSTADVAAAAADLAGLGGGLTPSGDDVLVGVLVAVAALADRRAEEIRHGVVGAAAGRTTRISAAYLASAVRGEGSEGWQRLLTALAGESPDAVVSAGHRVMAFGETSGTDMLTGFLLAMNALRA